MITLVIPATGVDKYFTWLNFIVGPFGSNGEVNEENMLFSSPVGAFIQGTGMFRENEVEQTKIDGVLHFVQGSLALIPTPTVNEPHKAKLSVYSKVTPGATAYLEAKYGLVVDTCVRHYKDAYSFYVGGAVYDRVLSMWKFYVISSPINAPTKVTYCYVNRLKSVLYKDSANYTIKTTSQQYPTGAGIISSVPLWSISSVGQLQEICAKASSVYPESALVSQVVPWSIIKPILPFSPSGLKAEILSFVADLDPVDYPVPETHYGDLAQVASSQVNANKVNMFEFLKDLRHPEHMLLKLRNLRNLKTWASNYLGVSYGVLPTLSDIQGIVDAFLRRKPFLDKNGFTVLTAKVDDTVVDGSKSFQLVQRLKLAISDEDDGYESLLERLESIGAWPTLENIWDLVPWSFAIDWLIDVGGYLERVDTRLRILKLNVRYVTMSRKTIASRKIEESLHLPYFGSIERVQYHRWVSDQCPVPPFPLPTNPFKDFDHWLESTALLVQRRKR